MEMKKEYIYVIILVVFVLCVECFKYIKKEFFTLNDSVEIVTVEPDYTIEYFDMNITVLESGDLKITEKIIYDLKNNSDQVYRNYTLEKCSGEKVNSYQPEKLGITTILCNGKELYGKILTSTGIVINHDQKTGLKEYEIEYVLEDAVEMCDNVSEFLCNLNIGTFDKEIKNFNLTLKAENGGKMLDVLFLGTKGITYGIDENGIVTARKSSILPGSKTWINVKLENSCVPKTNRIILEERAYKFGE